MSEGKTYGELVTLTHGIFEKMSYEFPNMTPQQMDTLFYGLFSQRWISPLFESCLVDWTVDEALTELAGIILGLNKDNWDKTLAALNYEYDLLDSYKVTYDFQSEYTEEGTVNDDGQNGIYGFDSEEAVGDTTAKNSRTRNETHKKHDQSTRLGRQGGTTPQEMIRQELDLRKRNFIDEVLHTVASVLFLEIY